MFVTLLRPLGCLALCLVASAATAQTPPLGDSAKAIVGTWEFSNADRDKICTATFKADPSPVGYKVEFDKNCAGLFPIVAEVAGWIFPENDLLRLLDAHKRTLVEFSEVEDNIYEAPTPGLGVLFLQNAADAAPPTKRAEQVAGTWAIKRGNGGLLCQLTLTMDAADDDDQALVVQPGCEATLARLNFVHWRMDRGELMIYPARGNPWRFEAIDDTSWRRLPERDNGYVLVKP